MLLPTLLSSALLQLGTETVRFDEVAPPLRASWSENLRWNLDVSQRVVLAEGGELGALGALGLDVHKVFSGASGDVATLVFQPYLLRADSLAPAPALFEEDHDYALQWRIVNANLRLVESGAANLRVGHFELPFGLEQNLDTNGTLRRTPHVGNFGFVADWGATLNGELDSVDYEVAWSRGSGNEYLDRGGDGVMSGRIGTPREGTTVLGASFVHGDFLRGNGTVRRTRVGLDGTHLWRAWTFQGELSHGQDSAAVDSTRLLVEANWRNPYETQIAWAQLFHTSFARGGPGGDVIEARLGYRIQTSKNWLLSAQVAHTLQDAAGADTPTSLTLQLRYRL